MPDARKRDDHPAIKARTTYEKPELVPLDRWAAEASGDLYGPPVTCGSPGAQVIR